MQDNKTYRNARQYYRIRYPHSYRPTVRVEGEDYDSHVIELSERGARFHYEGNSALHEGLDLIVNISFHDGESFELECTVLRVANNDVIVRFSDSLPLSRIMKEQIYLRNHFVGHM